LIFIRYYFQLNVAIELLYFKDFTEQNFLQRKYHCKISNENDPTCDHELNVKQDVNVQTVQLSNTKI